MRRMIVRIGVLGGVGGQSFRSVASTLPFIPPIPCIAPLVHFARPIPPSLAIADQAEAPAPRLCQTLPIGFGGYAVGAWEGGCSRHRPAPNSSPRPAPGAMGPPEPPRHLLRAPAALPSVSSIHYGCVVIVTTAGVDPDPTPQFLGCLCFCVVHRNPRRATSFWGVLRFA